MKLNYHRNNNGNGHWNSGMIVMMMVSSTSLLLLLWLWLLSTTTECRLVSVNPKYPFLVFSKKQKVLLCVFNDFFYQIPFPHPFTKRNQPESYPADHHYGQNQNVI